MKIFLSYTMRDGNVTLLRLRQASDYLRRFGSVFADAIHNADTDRQARVEREIAECDLVVSIETSAFRKSAWVYREQEIASRLQKKTISVEWLQGENWESVLSSILNQIEEERAANNAMHSDGNSAALHSRR